MLNLSGIETFVLVVETNSFTVAARARGISRAAASKQIAQLEESLGVPLLTRSTRHVVLTEEGQLVYEEARRIIDGVAEMEGMLSALKKEPSGMLSVVSGPVFAYRYIIPRLNEFLTKYPKVNIKLDFRHQMPNMMEEKVDIVVGVYGNGSPDSIQKLMLMTRRLFCATPSFLKKAGKIKRPEDLAGHPLIIHPVHPKDTHLILKDDKLINPPAKVIINDQLAIKKSTLDNLGIAYIQRHVVEDELREGTLVEVLSEFMERKDTIPIYLYYLQRRHIHSKVRAFIDFVAQNIADSELKNC